MSPASCATSSEREARIASSSRDRREACRATCSRAWNRRRRNPPGPPLGSRYKTRRSQPYRATPDVSERCPGASGRSAGTSRRAGVGTGGTCATGHSSLPCRRGGDLVGAEPGPRRGAAGRAGTAQRRYCASSSRRSGGCVAHGCPARLPGRAGGSGAERDSEPVQPLISARSVKSAVTTSAATQPDSHENERRVGRQRGHRAATRETAARRCAGGHRGLGDTEG